MKALVVFVGAILLRLLTSEIQDWLPTVSHWIIARAAARLPKYQRTRHFEEWLADNNSFPGRITKLLHAIGCIRASQKLKNDRTRARRKDTVGIQGNVLIEKLTPRVWEFMVTSVLWVSRTQEEKKDPVLFKVIVMVSHFRLRSKSPFENAF
jgi:hypothetical protein